MESNHLTTRTYTAPTCTLIVASKAVARGRNSEQLANPVDFSLELERSELGDLDRVILQGQPQQLEDLHHSVNTYVAELVAKFPIPTNDRRAPAGSTDPIDAVSPPPSSHLDPRDNSHSPRSGIIKNLPGLRGNLPRSPAAANSPEFDHAKPSISSLLGRWRKPNRPDPRAAAHSEPHPIVAPTANIEDRSALPTTPYLTGASERSLDHHLYLGDLATPTSSDKLTLSAIQLFDLATVLDEYAAEHVTGGDRPNILSRSTIRNRTDRSPSAGTLDSTHTHLPNLPRIPAQQPTEVGQAYYRTPRRSASFMSGIPWAVAAAIAVGVPLLLLDPNPNPLKDAANKVKIPNLAGGTKKTTVATVPGATPTQSNLNPTGIPTPWQQQPVQPPIGTNPLDPTKSPTPQDPNKIGTAAFPDAIMGSGQVPTTPGNLNPAIAPNPLTAKLPGATASNPNTTTPTPTSSVKPNPLAKTPAGTSQTTKIGQLPIDAGTSSKVSLSNQPILIPPARQQIGSTPTATPIPFNRSGLDELGRIDPATRSNPKKTVGNVKPSPPTKPKQTVLKPTPASVAPPASLEPFTPVPTNPNLIDPNQNSPESTEEPAQVVPNQPLQSNAGGFGTDSVEIPSLQETKRYFQGKWKATNTQTNALQYVLQVSGKSGTVQSVAPQGAAATTYLQQTKFIKAGQKLISPAAAGSSDQKIRVLLQPDGNVDTFIEP